MADRRAVACYEGMLGASTGPVSLEVTENSQAHLATNVCLCAERVRGDSSGLTFHSSCSIPHRSKDAWQMALIKVQNKCFRATRSKV